MFFKKKKKKKRKSFIKKSVEQSKSKGVYKALSQNKLATKVINHKYSIRKLYYGPLVLAVYRYLGENVKYRLLSKHLFQRK